MDRPALLRVNHLIAARENRQTILRLLQRQGPCSQRQLAIQTRLRPSTMSYIIRDLTRWGFIQASGVVPTRRTGRKEVLLSLDGSRAWAAGIDLDRNSTELLLVDAAHEILFHKAMELDYNDADFFKTLSTELEAARKKLGLQEKKCLGAGVSVAGAVDFRAGIVLKSVPLNLSGHPMGGRFGEKLKLPVTVEHNAICGGYAEKLLGAAKAYDHFLAFLIRPGRGPGNFYGTAFYLNGTFYRGAHSSAGELDQLLEPDASGDFTGQLAQVIASLANLFDPQAVILLAEDKFRAEAPLDELNARVSQSLIPVPDRNIPLHWNQLRHGALAYGAALMRLHEGIAALLTHLVK